MGDIATLVYDQETSNYTLIKDPTRYISLGYVDIKSSIFFELIEHD